MRSILQLGKEVGHYKWHTWCWLFSLGGTPHVLSCMRMLPYVDTVDVIVAAGGIYLHV
jgi:hypothetical protein